MPGQQDAGIEEPLLQVAPLAKGERRLDVDAPIRTVAPDAESNRNSSGGTSERLRARGILRGRDNRPITLAARPE
jgi:hypothetical protein